MCGRSNNNANANGGLAYANANNASSNSNTNNGSRLANYDNRLYGVPSRDGGRLRARSPSLGNSSPDGLESGNINGATYYRQVERSKVSMVVREEGLTL